MRNTMTRAEGGLLVLLATLLLAGLAGPQVPNPAHYHAFADQRGWLGIPHALDVLSNLPFAVAGIAGFALLRGMPATQLPPVQRDCAVLFFAGLVLTTFCSVYYHLQPDDRGLAVDRAGMGVAFAGILGLLVATQVSERAGRWTAAAVLLLAPVAVGVSLATGNVLPWALLQGGGLVLLFASGLARPRPGALQVRWILVPGVYALAKLFELADHAVFDATGGWVAGHTVKHLLAAGAAWPMLSALRRVRPVQNDTTAAATARA